MGRCNRDMVDPAGCLDLDSDSDMANALLGAAEGSLEDDERAPRLAGSIHERHTDATGLLRGCLASLAAGLAALDASARANPIGC